MGSQPLCRVYHTVHKVLKYSEPPVALTARISSSNANCYARACGSKTFLTVIMSYTNIGPTQFGMGSVEAVMSQTYTATEDIAGLLSHSSYGLLTVRSGACQRVRSSRPGTLPRMPAARSPHFARVAVGGSSRREQSSRGGDRVGQRREGSGASPALMTERSGSRRQLLGVL